MRHREWFVQPATATSGDGIHEGLDWLATTFSKQPSGARRR